MQPLRQAFVFIARQYLGDDGLDHVIYMNDRSQAMRWYKAVSILRRTQLNFNVAAPVGYGSADTSFEMAVDTLYDEIGACQYKNGISHLEATKKVIDRILKDGPGYTDGRQVWREVAQTRATRRKYERWTHASLTAAR